MCRRSVERRHHVYTKASALSVFQQRSALRDLAFFVLRVLAARVAELLDLELLGLCALVLVSDVVIALAVLTGELDEVSHGAAPVKRVAMTIITVGRRRSVQRWPWPEKPAECSQRALEVNSDPSLPCLGTGDAGIVQ